MSVRVVLVGFSASGKTTVGSKLAALKGRLFVDVDALVEEREGRSITEIIRVDGEERFRDLESQTLNEALSSKAEVISTGGGVLLRAANRQAISASGAVAVHLGVSAECAAARLSGHQGVTRPLLAEDDLLGSVRSLMQARAGLYDGFALNLWTDWVDADQAAAELAFELSLAEASGSITVVPFSAGGRATKVVCGSGVLASLPARVKSLSHGATQLALIVDRQVWSLHGEELEALLGAAGLNFLLCLLAPGEATKSLTVVENIAEQLLAGSFTRSDVVVAVGGGVVGDVAGLLSSLFMRGVPLVHVPTTVVAQADAAIGGKTAVNLYGKTAGGKNVLGTFYPADLVLSDVALLRTLPQRVFCEGLAEVVKYGAIYSEDFLLWLERNCERVLARDEVLLREIVEFSSKAKLRFVVGDVEDRAGVRAQLNFGHTLGHAIERLQGYSGFLHGEAVSVGMVFSLMLGEELGLTQRGLSARLADLLSRIGLPTSVPQELMQGADGCAAQAGAKRSADCDFRKRWEGAIKVDKKRRAEVIDFVFVRSAGAAMTSPIAVRDIVDFLAKRGKQEDE